MFAWGVPAMGGMSLTGLTYCRYCKYNGKFTIEGGEGDCKPTMTYPDNKKSKAVYLVAPGSQDDSSSTVWRIKSTKKGALITPSEGKSRGYLTPVTPVGSAEWDTEVKMALTKKKNYYILRQIDVSDTEIDCLKSINMLSMKEYTCIAYDPSGCGKGRLVPFRYESDEWEWTLEPAR